MKRVCHEGYTISKGAQNAQCRCNPMSTIQEKLLMNQKNRSQAEWLWQQLQSLSESADQRKIDPLITVWACLRFSLWLNFNRAPTLAVGKSVATQVMAHSLAAAQKEMLDPFRITAKEFAANSHSAVPLH